MLKRLYYPDDLQKMLDHLRKNPKDKEAVIAHVQKSFEGVTDYCNDCAALLRVINSGSAETFSKYDSAVREKFVTLTEDLYGENWHVDGIKPLNMDITGFESREPEGGKE